VRGRRQLPPGLLASLLLPQLLPPGRLLLLKMILALPEPLLELLALGLCTGPGSSQLRLLLRQLLLGSLRPAFSGRLPGLRLFQLLPEQQQAAVRLFLLLSCCCCCC
jgi:hypothetical protein